MIINRILKVGYPKSLPLSLIMAHTDTCPIKRESSDGTDKSILRLKIPLKTSKVRMGFIPEEWFLFFHCKTGVSGPYLFGLGVVNYLLSKEIYVMEHEYYTALSIFPMVYYTTTKYGKDIAKALDEQVDDHVNTLEKIRQDEKNYYLEMIKDSKDSQMRVEGQKLLIDAKKENVLMQLEAVYRERLMEIYRTVKNRLDFQVKRERTHNKIEQKWIIQYIMENVMKEITPEFQERYFNSAIEEIKDIANRAK